MTPEAWSQIVSALVTLVLAVLVPLLGLGIQAVLKKMKLDNNVAVQTAVRSGIAFAEEKGAVLLKTQGVKLDPSEKLNAAVERVLLKIPNVSQAEAEALVHEELVKVGLGAAATFQSLANATRP